MRHVAEKIDYDLGYIVELRRVNQVGNLEQKVKLFDRQPKMKKHVEKRREKK